MDIWLHLCGLSFEYQLPSIARRLARHAGEVLMVDWANRRPRNIRFMRVRVRIDPWKPLVAGCILKRTNGFISWVEFQYETIKKYCLNCGIIGHTYPICPHTNAEIETMLNAHAATSSKNYGTSEVYDLQHNLYSNRIRAYAHRRSRGTSRITYRGAPNENPEYTQPEDDINNQEEENIQTRDDNVEMQQVGEETQYQQKGDMNGQAVTPDINDEDIVPINVNDGYNADTEGGSDSPENQFTPSLPSSPSFGLEPVMGLEETRERLLTNTLQGMEHRVSIDTELQVMQEEHNKVQAMCEEMIKQNQKIMEDFQMRHLNDPFRQPLENEPRWINLPEGGILFTNGRLANEGQIEIGESSRMGASRNMGVVPENPKADSNDSQSSGQKRRRDLEVDEEEAESSSGRQLRRRLQLLDVNEDQIAAARYPATENSKGLRQADPNKPPEEP
ncbi:Zinc knuckle CX2CX4HX4C [Corchorus olitorius]|uniref:Zinc knuckle CX2CX4HX4C n=1 Tax=Corchorus olitorius TaxID=93759 RepID=A0A1R3HCZ9_9ROSI|nr:Zinc knuckle CX2CX4HX4C [Corchorus olitorius]